MEETVNALVQYTRYKEMHELLTDEDHAAIKRMYAIKSKLNHIAIKYFSVENPHHLVTFDEIILMCNSKNMDIDLFLEQDY